MFENLKKSLLKFFWDIVFTRISGTNMWSHWPFDPCKCFILEVLFEKFLNGADKLRYCIHKTGRKDGQSEMITWKLPEDPSNLPAAQIHTFHLFSATCLLCLALHLFLFGKMLCLISMKTTSLDLSCKGMKIFIVYLPANICRICTNYYSLLTALNLFIHYVFRTGCSKWY